MEQRISVVPDEEQVDEPVVGEADPADVLEQSRSVPMDEDDV